MNYNTVQLLAELKRSEGVVLTVYKDSLGIDTIGIGRNLRDRGISDEEFDMLHVSSMEEVYAVGINEGEALYLASNDIKIAETELLKKHPCIEELDPVRQMVVIDMAFNMGVPRLCGFKRMWENIHNKNYDGAASEMLDSRWATQVKSRATRLADKMRNGTKNW